MISTLISSFHRLNSDALLPILQPSRLTLKDSPTQRQRIHTNKPEVCQRRPVICIGAKAHYALLLLFMNMTQKVVNNDSQLFRSLVHAHMTGAFNDRLHNIAAFRRKRPFNRDEPVILSRHQQ